MESEGIRGSGRCPAPQSKMSVLRIVRDPLPLVEHSKVGYQMNLANGSRHLLNGGTMSGKASEKSS
jgi:hypothetical protein